MPGADQPDPVVQGVAAPFAGTMDPVRRT